MRGSCQLSRQKQDAVSLICHLGVEIEDDATTKHFSISTSSPGWAFGSLQLAFFNMIIAHQTHIKRLIKLGPNKTRQEP